MNELRIDIETYSSFNLGKTGVYKYVEAPDFEILLFSYSEDGNPVQVIDFAQGEKIPDRIIAAIQDPCVIKWAFNAQFERICLSKFLGLKYLDPSSWRCTRIWSAYLGLPLSLEDVGRVLGLEKQKMAEGKDLIRYFCVPVTPSKANGERTRNCYYHDMEKWEQFKMYNVRDVEVERDIQQKLRNFPVSETEWENYVIDQQINDRGILLDLELVTHAIEMGEKAKTDIMGRMQKLTGLENPNSVTQLRDWLSFKGVEAESLDKKSVNQLLDQVPNEVQKVLLLRQQSAKSSVKKYSAMMDCVCEDGRARGLLQFYGANRTGRFAGRLIQVQNLPRNNMVELEDVRSLVKQNHYDSIDMLFDSVPQCLSELIRTAFIPEQGKRFIIADFSAIEARVLAWIAGEQWRMELFEKGGDVYCQSASKMFGVPVQKHGINGHLRQKGKIAELACGYGGSVGALAAMGALEMGIPESELQGLVDAWREANSQIVNLWWEIDNAAKIVIKERCKVTVRNIELAYKGGMLVITLPSGRSLYYVKPAIGENRFGGESITFEGIGAMKRWERIETYGAKIVENIVQAVSRDLLCHAMQQIQAMDIVMHIHDEVVLEADHSVSVEEICQKISKVPSWATGLTLDADGFEAAFYKKD